MSMSKDQEVTGRLTRHPDGYGFVEVPDGEDIFIPPKNFGGAMHGDTVRVYVQSSRRRGRRGKKGKRRGKDESREGRVVEVVERPRRPLVGRLERYRGRAYVIPLDDRYANDVLVPDLSEDIEEGLLVAISLLSDPQRRDRPLGRLIEVLGHENDPDIEYKIVCFGHDIPMVFPQAVLDAAEQCAPPASQDLEDRRDLRDTVTVTIDGQDARDFDDAVSLSWRQPEESPDEVHAFRLGVHIADVSHYVEHEGLIDHEARRRGTSVYFPDRAYPMLPERLSNILCSLRPHEDRLSVSVFMDFDENGRRQDMEVCISVIRSQARLTYTQVQEILDRRERGEAPRPGLEKELGRLLSKMHHLSRLLRRRRMQEGALDLELPEAKVVFDDNQEIADIVEAPRLEAHQLIEEFMLAANHAVAEFVERRNIGMIYRVHEDPDPEKVEQFAELAAPFGYNLPGRPGHREPQHFQKMLDQMKGTPQGRFLTYRMLRSFQQARYSTENEGHFGLASELYTHFTSPIRRYPDLLIHRLLKFILEKRHKTAACRHFAGDLPEMARHASQRERTAVEAEREIIDWMQTVFMSGHLGDEYEAVVTGVRSRGFYVQLDEHYVEGFIPVESMHDDYYVFKEQSHTLVGRDKGRKIRLGDGVTVRVDRVDKRRRHIDMSLA
ncbi:MAG TPA: ribonuclease R [Acidobacteriota bacterium]|nr:ribonuclease R [Acidobacteriota bacterium]